jgi:hypothetical protein
LEKNQDKIDWDMLSQNPAARAIALLEKNKKNILVCVIQKYVSKSNRVIGKEPRQNMVASVTYCDFKTFLYFLVSEFFLVLFLCGCLLSSFFYL